MRQEDSEEPDWKELSVLVKSEVENLALGREGS